MHQFEEMVEREVNGLSKLVDVWFDCNQEEIKRRAVKRLELKLDIIFRYLTIKKKVFFMLG